MAERGPTVFLTTGELGRERNSGRPTCLPSNITISQLATVELLAFAVMLPAAVEAACYLTDKEAMLTVGKDKFATGKEELDMGPVEVQEDIHRVTRVAAVAAPMASSTLSGRSQVKELMNNLIL